MKIRISKIRQKSQNRPAGYFEHVMSSGKVVGEFLEIDDQELQKLRETYKAPEKPVVIIRPPESKSILAPEWVNLEAAAITKRLLSDNVDSSKLQPELLELLSRYKLETSAPGCSGCKVRAAIHRLQQEVRKLVVKAGRVGFY